MLSERDSIHVIGTIGTLEIIFESLWWYLILSIRMRVIPGSGSFCSSWSTLKTALFSAS